MLWRVGVGNPLDKNDEGIFMSKVGVDLGIGRGCYGE